LRIGLRTDQAGEAVAGVATDAAAFVRVLLVEHDADRNVEGLQSRAREIIGQLLNARLMTHGRVRVGTAGIGFARIFAANAVHAIQLFRLKVVGFELCKRQRPATAIDARPGFKIDGVERPALLAPARG